MKDTEEAIKEAAKKEFVLNGLKGARMQAIADGAGINRALLHYYFRSKIKLFEVIFDEIMGNAVDRLGLIVQSDMSIWGKIENFITVYFDQAMIDPDIDLFLMNEFKYNSDHFQHMFKSSKVGKSLRSFIEELTKSTKNGELKGDPIQIFISLISLSIFPFAAKDMIKILACMSPEEYNLLLKNRKEHVLSILKKAFG